MKRYVRFAVAGAILLGGILLFVGLAGLRNTPLPSNPPRPVPEVETITVRKTDLAVGIPAQGVIEPVLVTRAAAEVDGVIIAVSPGYKVGGEFKKGDVLLEIDPSDYEALVAQAEAAVAEARLQLSDEEMRARQAERDWNRLASPGQEPTELVRRLPQLAAARARLKATEASLDRAKKDLERTKLRAPYDGRIRGKLADLGTHVGKGVPLLECYATDVFEVRLPIPRSDTAFFEVAGQELELRERGGRGRTWKAVLDRSEGEIRRDDRTLVVVAELDGQAPGAPLPGQFVETDIPGRVVSGVVRVPRRAFATSDRVLVVSDGHTVATRAVTILRTEHDDVLVTGGIEEGEQLCITALAAVIEGMEVRVVSRDGNAVLSRPAAP